MAVKLPMAHISTAHIISYVSIRVDKHQFAVCRIMLRVSRTCLSQRLVSRPSLRGLVGLTRSSPLK